MLILKDHINTSDVILKLKSMIMRFLITLICLLVAIISYVVTYVICELLEVQENEVRNEHYQTDFTFIAKTF